MARLGRDYVIDAGAPNGERRYGYNSALGVLFDQLTVH
jgi:hypothetical protein